MVKVPPKKELLGFYFPVSVFGIIFLIGLAFIPEDFQVQPEYINTILASSSILFGFWAVSLGMQPSKKEAKDVYIGFTGIALSVNIGLLASSVILVFFTAMGRLPSKYALTFVTISFLMNVYSFALYLYLYAKGQITTLLAER